MKRAGWVVALAAPVVMLAGGSYLLFSQARPAPVARPSPSPSFTVPAHLPSPVVHAVGIAPSGNWLRDEASFARRMHARPGMIQFYQRFGKLPDLAKLRLVGQMGAVPVLQLNPRFVSVQAIADRKWNGYLARLGAELRKYGKPVILSFAHEMNGNWETWGDGRTPASVFIDAWRVVWRNVEAAGAHPVWMWNISREGTGVALAGPWWPGRHYVDVVGIDAYYRMPHETLSDLLGRTMTTVRALTRKPVIVSETAAGRGPRQGSQIRQLFGAVRRGVIGGFIWFDMDAKERWALHSNPVAVRELRAGMGSLLLPVPVKAARTEKGRTR